MLCPISGPAKKSIPIFLRLPLRLKEHNKVPPHSSLVQGEQLQFSQPFLTGEVFQPSANLPDSPLDPFKQVCPVLGLPELDAAL